MNFTPIDNNGLVDGFCIIKSIDQKTSSKGDAYLDMMLGDSDGEINAKLWRYSKELHGEYAANELVKIRGMISQYNGADQLKIERIRHTTDNDGVNPADFVKTAAASGEGFGAEQTILDMTAGRAHSFIAALDRTDNDKIYGELADSDIYVQSIIDFISGMTDPFAISLFEELISYG